MDRRHFLAATVTASVAGCLGRSDGTADSRLALTVQNDRGAPVSVQIVVVDAEGTTYAAESARIDSGVARAFDVSVGSTGRHEVTVSGDDFSGALAWNAETCARYEGTVGVTAETVAVAGACLEQW